MEHTTMVAKQAADMIKDVARLEAEYAAVYEPPAPICNPAVGVGDPRLGLRAAQHPAIGRRQRSNTFLNCQGSLLSMSSSNRPDRPSSGVQSV